MQVKNKQTTKHNMSQLPDVLKPGKGKWNQSVTTDAAVHPVTLKKPPDSHWLGTHANPAAAGNRIFFLLLMW